MAPFSGRVSTNLAPTQNVGKRWKYFFSVDLRKISHFFYSIMCKVQVTIVGNVKFAFVNISQLFKEHKKDMKSELS